MSITLTESSIERSDPLQLNSISNNYNFNNNINNENLISISPSSQSRYEIRNKLKDLETNSKNVKPNINLDEIIEEKYFSYNFDLEIKTSSHLSAKQYLLIIPITNFFKKARNLYLLYNILKCKSVISLRLIEYFVVNYVLENNTHFNLTRYKKNLRFMVDNLFNIKKSWSEYNILYNDELAGFNDLFMIHDNYKCKLKEYNKKNFDPFCRWERVTMTYEREQIIKDGEIITIKEKSFETTVAQLNFFKWIIENHILDYIIENFEEINKSMNEFEKDVKRNKNSKNKLTTTNINNLLSDINENNIMNDLNEELKNKKEMKPNHNNDINLSKKTRKKEVIYCNADKKTNKKLRVKKEFTKTNRNIMKYNKEIILKFN